MQFLFISTDLVILYPFEFCTHLTFNPLLPGTSASVSHVRFFLLSLFNKADLYRLLHQSQLLLIQKRQKKMNGL